MTNSQSDEERDRPVLRVVRGDASAEELAALLAVVQAAGSVAPEEPPAAGEWGSPRRAVHAPLMASPDAWRTSGLPH